MPSTVVTVHFLLTLVLAVEPWRFEYKEKYELRANISTLKFVHALFRHGDRNPVKPFPLDAGNQEESWEGGLEELTSLGIQQHYELGQFLKKRYQGFLSDRYNYKEIAARSTGVNRTIASALVNLAGMYPPRGNEIWNRKMQWQPIPVHSVPLAQERLLYVGIGWKCPSLVDVSDQVFSSPEAQKIQNENAPFFEFLAKKTGYSPVSFKDNLLFVFDTLHCLISHSDTHKKPDWATDEVIEKIKRLFKLRCDMWYGRPEVKRLYSGLLFQEVARKMVDIKSNHKSSTFPLKYQGYFAHDFNQIGILQNLGAYDGSFPTYGQALLIEMHEISGDCVVKIYKKNDTISGHDTLIPIQVPDCGDPCTVEKFYEISVDRAPKNFETECGLKKDS